MKRLLFSCALLLVFSLSVACARAETIAGTWRIDPSSQAGKVDLELRYARTGVGGNEQWSDSEDTPISELHGLSSTDLQSNGQTRTFSIVKDAGRFEATGTFGRGEGAGTWTFAPDASFAGALRRRGIGAPNEKRQFELAIARFKLSTLDALLREGFERPSIDDLVAMGAHGVDDDYINAMKDVHLSPKRVSGLIRMRDHGVTPKYAADMLRRAPQLTADDLVALRDHGVSSEYVQALADAGYSNVSPADMQRLVDHAVSVSFIERMRQHGYAHLSVDELIRLRDHGF